MFKNATLGLKEALLGLSPAELEDEDESVSSPVSTPRRDPPDLKLHRAAFENDVQTLRALVKTYPLETLLALDPHGNTALHVAVIAHSEEAVAALLAAGVSPEVRSRKKWNPLDEAVALQDRTLVRMLLEQLRLEVKRERKARKPRLVAVMRELPDFSMQLKWNLKSPLLGLLLRRYAPDDTYTIYKVGLQLRIDGELRGLDPNSRSLLPRWRRGPFSLLVDASTTPVAASLVDHTDRTWVDLYAERKAVVKDMEQDVSDVIEAGSGRVRLKGNELDFAPVKTWLGRPATAKVEGHDTEVFQCSGALVAVVLKKAPWVMPKGATFDEYLRMCVPADESEEVPWDPLQGPPPSVTQIFAAEDSEAAVEVASAAGTPGSAGQQAHSTSGSSEWRQEEARKVSGRCWMARDFPMTLQQLLPLMEAMGSANKHIAAATGFIRQYKDRSLFPLKIQVPLMWTVYLQMKFKAYRELRPGSRELALRERFFDVPGSYKLERVQLAGPELEESSRGEEETFYEARSGGESGKEVAAAESDVFYEAEE